MIPLLIAAACTIACAPPALAQAHDARLPAGSPGIGASPGPGAGLGLRVRLGGRPGRDAGDDAIELDGRLRLESFSLLGDWHPRATGFRISAGLLGAAPRTNSTAWSGPAAPGRADPYLGIGWSWPAARGRGLGMHADAGVRLRLPRAGLDAAGMALADSAADALGERTAVDGRARYRPVVSVGLSYGF